MQKNIKKILTFILIVLCTFLLVSCENTKIDNNLYNALNTSEITFSTGDSENSVTTDITFTNPNIEGVSYAWKSSNTSIITNDGKVELPDEDSVVTITLLILYDNELYEKKFDVKVLAKEDVINEEEKIDDSKSDSSDDSKSDSSNDSKSDSSNDSKGDSSDDSKGDSSNDSKSDSSDDSKSDSSDDSKGDSSDDSKGDNDETLTYTYDITGKKSLLQINELHDVEENKPYNDYLDVVAYIHLYHKLPCNFYTKSQAKNLGWKGSGNVWVNDKLRNCNIGGDIFYNREGVLPYVSSYVYVELDVNYTNGSRGSKRIVYNSNTWDIYYTSDHYESFIYMIGEIK